MMRVKYNLILLLMLLGLSVYSQKRKLIWEENFDHFLANKLIGLSTGDFTNLCFLSDISSISSKFLIDF